MLKNVSTLKGVKILTARQKKTIVAGNDGCAFFFTRPDGFVTAAGTGLSYEAVQNNIDGGRENGFVIRWCCATCEGRAWYEMLIQ